VCQKLFEKLPNCVKNRPRWIYLLRDPFCIETLQNLNRLKTKSCESGDISSRLVTLTFCKFLSKWTFCCFLEVDNCFVSKATLPRRWMKFHFRQVFKKWQPISSFTAAKKSFRFSAAKLIGELAKVKNGQLRLKLGQVKRPSLTKWQIKLPFEKWNAHTRTGVH
jgi:hypothetical protein